MIRRLFAVLLSVAGMAGCQVGREFEPSVVEAAPVWGPSARVPSRTVADEADPEWWRALGDPELTALVTRLADQNLDLKAATERVVQNAAQRQVIASRALPNIEGQSIDFYNRPSQNGISSEIGRAHV